jgi:hypothetical protein
MNEPIDAFHESRVAREARYARARRNINELTAEGSIDHRIRFLMLLKLRDEELAEDALDRAYFECWDEPSLHLDMPDVESSTEGQQ